MTGKPRRGLSEMDLMARENFIGGSEARIIMGDDFDALLTLWREKRGEQEHEDLSDQLLPQLGTVTEPLNIEWCERFLPCRVTGVQRVFRYEEHPFMSATVDATAETSDLGSLIIEAKYMLPWNWSAERALAKYNAQLQHNMLCAGVGWSVLSVITGDGKWTPIRVSADAIYQEILTAAELDFWDCVKSGRAPSLVNAPAAATPEGVVDMTRGNRAAEWEAAAETWVQTRLGALTHKAAEEAVKDFMPPDAAEAYGNGVKCRRGKDGRLRVSQHKESMK